MAASRQQAQGRKRGGLRHRAETRPDPWPSGHEPDPSIEKDSGCGQRQANGSKPGTSARRRSRADGRTPKPRQQYSLDRERNAGVFGRPVDLGISLEVERPAHPQPHRGERDVRCAPPPPPRAASHSSSSPAPASTDAKAKPRGCSARPGASSRRREHEEVREPVGPPLGHVKAYRSARRCAGAAPRRAWARRPRPCSRARGRRCWWREWRRSRRVRDDELQDELRPAHAAISGPGRQGLALELRSSAPSRNGLLASTAIPRSRARGSSRCSASRSSGL